MFEGTNLFQDTGGWTVDPNTGDVNGTGADLPGSQGGGGGWFDSLGKLGGKAIDAYKSYIGLESERANIDAARDASRSAQESARQKAQLERDLLGFQGQAERARAAKAAALAQSDYQSTASGGGLSVGLVLLVAIGYVALRAS